MANGISQLDQKKRKKKKTNQDVGNRLESLYKKERARHTLRKIHKTNEKGLEGPTLEVGHLLEGISKLDDRGGAEQPVGVHDQRAVLERVEIAGDEQQVGTRLDGQESVSGHVDALGVSEVLDGGSDGGLELKDGSAIVGDLVVDDDFHGELLLLHHSLHSLQVDPHCSKQTPIHRQRPSEWRESEGQKKERIQLLVLKILNFLMDLKSSKCSSGTWATSRSRMFPSTLTS